MRHMPSPSHSSRFSEDYSYYVKHNLPAHATAAAVVVVVVVVVGVVVAAAIMFCFVVLFAL